MEEIKNTVTKPMPNATRFCGFGPGKLLAGCWRKSLWRDQAGSEVVEFTLSAGVFMACVFGFMELCVVLFMLNSVNEAARQGARWASVRGTSSSVTSSGTTTCVNPHITTCPAQSSDIQNYVDTMPGMSASRTTVTVNWCNAAGTSCTTTESNATPGNMVEVKVSYKFASVPYFSSTAITLTSTAEKVIWQ